MTRVFNLVRLAVSSMTQTGTTPVAQVSNLLYRGFPNPRAPRNPKHCRLEVADTAGWKPALHHRISARLHLGGLALLLMAPLLMGAVVAPGPAAPTQDPLMALMLSQPRIDTTSPVVATASFDPPIISPGAPCTYRVVFSALEESIEWPDKISGPAQMKLSPRAHGQILQMAGNVLVPQTTFNSRVRVTTVGDYILPQFTVKAYGKDVIVPPARLQVLPNVPPMFPRAQELLMEIPATNLFAGESIRVRVLLPGSERGTVQGLSQVQLNGEGLLVDQSSARPRVEAVSRGGTNFVAFIYEVTATPIATGNLRIYAQGFTSGSRFAGPIVMAGPQYTLVDSDPLELRVRPLPKEGELPGFSGAIGSFSLDPPRLATNTVRVGEPLKMMVAIHGDLTASRIVPPPLPRSPQWQVFTVPDHNPGQPRAPQGPAIEFTFTLVPTTTEARSTPAIPFSYFDPAKRAYIDLTIPPVSVTVLPGTLPTQLVAAPAEEQSPQQTDTPGTLHDLAKSPGRSSFSLVPVQRQTWFPLLQLIPASLFLGLLWWDRRRKHLEQNPGIVLRRRARRALRRERRTLRRAAQDKDPNGFIASAVKAMRLGCAPHYPAEPKALVGRDVLEVLRDSTNSTRKKEVVRRIFNISDESRFSTLGRPAQDVLSMEPELEQVLEELEARLCA